jgi:hypothetical protein
MRNQKMVGKHPWKRFIFCWINYTLGLPNQSLKRHLLHIEAISLFEYPLIKLRRITYEDYG